MVTSPGYLCLVLTLWIAVLRLSAAVRTGSPDPVWWGTKESAQAGDDFFHKRLGEALHAGARIGSKTDRLKTLLSRLRAEPVRGLRIGGRKILMPDRFRLRFTETEAPTGLGDSLNPIENFLSGDSLIHFQHGLRALKCSRASTWEKGGFSYESSRETR